MTGIGTPVHIENKEPLIASDLRRGNPDPRNHVKQLEHSADEIRQFLVDPGNIG